jgi:outer membrane protein, heavy metal efflux system
MVAAMVGLTGCLATDPAARFDTASGLSYVPGAADGGEAAEAEAGITLTETSGLDDYVAYATANNAGLEAAFNRWRAAVERVPQVTALPDPRLSYRYYLREVETRVGPMRQSFGLSQTFPWLGKLALRGSAAAQAAEAERLRFEAARLKLAYEVTSAYAEYYHLGRRIAVVEDNLKLVGLAEQVARARYRTSKASYPDVIRAQVELARLDERLKSLRDLRGPVVARLNAALNRPAEADLPWPTTLPDKVAGFSDEQALSWLDDSNPELKAMDAEVAAQAHRVELARKASLPDVTLGVDYTQIDRRGGPMRPSDDGKDAVALMVSVNLPIWRDKIEAGVREARHRQWAAERARGQKRNDLAGQLKLALYRFRDAGRKTNLYRDTLLPKGREAVKTLQAAFRSGRASFTDLIDAQRVLLEFELAGQRAVADRVQRLAEIDMLAGLPLRRIQSEPNDHANDAAITGERTKP